MIDDRAVELHLETFCEVFRLVHHFGGPHRGAEGYDDGNEGVQWNTWVEWDDRGLAGGHVAVNLEGKEYDGWPIARLIERELGSFALFKAIAYVHRREEITVRWSRDAWPRPTVPYPEYLIVRVRLSELTERIWKSALVEAQGCLNPERGFRGRALRQPITLNGNTHHLDVSPHLQFIRELWRGQPPSQAGLTELMQDAQRELLPLHKAVSDLSARPA